MFNWKSIYNSLHATFPGTQHKPVIGITGNFGDKGCELAEGYFESILRAGGTPVILPPTTDGDALVSMLDRIDGLLLSGGADLNPLYLGEEPIPALGGINARRDLSELLLIRLAFDRQLPILGICRGIQLLAAALDGSIWQDLATQFSPSLPVSSSSLSFPVSSSSPSFPVSSSVAPPSATVPSASPEGSLPSPLLKHSQTLDRSVASHTVTLAEGSLLHSIMDTGTLAVNSFHHQAVRDPGPHLRVAATAPDGVIEAVESTEHKSILGVQWHPECFTLAGDDSMLPLFRWLSAEAANYREARRIHSRILTLDSHCDTPMLFDQDIHFNQRDPRILVDLHKMTEGGLDATIMVAYIPQGPLTSEGRAAATQYADRQLRRVREMVATCAPPCAVDGGSSAVTPPASAVSLPPSLARTPAALSCLKSEGRRAIMLGIENGYAIGRDLSLLRHFKEEHGIVYMTLCHNGNNDICGSARPKEGESLTGVTPFGAEVIAEMNRLGIMVDLSHASECSFYDALDISRMPIVCSHSSSRALCDHPRNLTDDQLRALVAAGGVAQVTFYGGFLRKDGQATILDAVAHLNHMVEVMGIEHVGIGTDFDGDGGVPGLASASELINFTRRLLRERYTEDDLRLIWGGNFLRVMAQVQNPHHP
ncbi:MAG: gamma-glutamyl-gamma-aminobutyrate hydrolase family protein [Bacteroidaceae bacterium]|nr:gamma-glutamyl-gamma-aminobutyrate hydrolase family protein [Bacteroidaceae bacterium]